MRGGDEIAIIGQRPGQQAEAGNLTGKQGLAQAQVLHGARFEPIEQNLAREGTREDSSGQSQQNNQRRDEESAKRSHDRWISTMCRKLHISNPGCVIF
ncbi:hypothetical protein GCM10019060_39120 [Novosphingobium pokkalii]|nr:hypothetical protein GCM10019060_39120 [Novosphingobium pokkalii]